MLLRCHPILTGMTLPTRDMPTHTGFVHGDALRRPYCAGYAVRFALKSPFSSAPTLPGLSSPGALCTGEFCGGTYAFSLVWWDFITSRK